MAETNSFRHLKIHNMYIGTNRSKSKSTDKLELLIEVAKTMHQKIESCDSIKLTWKHIHTGDEDIVVPEVEIVGLKMKK